MPESESANELIEKIKADIQNSGFPLEFYVLNACSVKNTGRMPGLRYEFFGKERELDLLAFFEHISMNRRKDANAQHTRTNLIIECKRRTDKPWVFMSSPSYSFPHLLYFLQYVSDYDRYFSSKQLPALLPQIFQKLRSNYYGDSTIRRCTSYYEAFRKQDQPSDIYKAIDSVLSFMLYRCENRTERVKLFGTVSEFYLPIVVLDGKLFEASTSPDKIELCERAHIQLRTFYREAIYVIDFVTKAYFPTFLNKVESLHSEIVSAIRALQLPPDFRNIAWKKRNEVMNSTPHPSTLMQMADTVRQRPKGRKPR